MSERIETERCIKALYKYSSFCFFPKTQFARAQRSAHDSAASLLVWNYIIIISATNEPEYDVELLRPTNTIAKVGDSITLPCTSRVNNESRWDFYAFNGLKLTNVYNGNRVNTELRRHMQMNFYSCRLKTCPLTMKSVRLQDAGYYICFESTRAVRKAASLTVLGQWQVL